MPPDPIEVIANLISDKLKEDSSFQGWGYSTHYIDFNESIPRFYVILSNAERVFHELTPNIFTMNYIISIGCLVKDKRDTYKFEEKIFTIIGDASRDPTAKFYNSSSLYEVVINDVSTSVSQVGSVAVFNREISVIAKRQYVNY